MKNFKFLLVPVILFLTSCDSQNDKDLVNQEKLKSQILTLHQELIDAHLNKNLDYFGKNLSSNFISVNNGDIARPTADEISSNMKNYISSSTFTEYYDLQEPIIGFSKDGSFAWSIVQVKVKGKRTLEDGEIRDIDFTCAWMTLYEKNKDEWITLAEASTFK